MTDPPTASSDALERHMSQLIRDMHGGHLGSTSPTVRGRAFGRYVLLGEVGRGATGTVLKAYDESLDRAIAIKQLVPEAAEQHAERLKREAQALAKLSHPNVVHVYEVGQADGRWFIAEELIEGRTLRSWQEVGRPWRDCVRIYVQVGEGLAAAHAAGLVHRDFKPDNCVVDETMRPRVLDFGLVGLLPASVSTLPESDDDSRNSNAMDDPDVLTRTGTILGTPAYMAPEQMAGGEVDARSDQFSFCVSLYEALYGERPFSGRTWAALRASLHRGTPRAPPAGARVPVRLRRILARGLAVDAEQRWPSMDALLGELRAVLAPRSRWWWALAAAAVVPTVGWSAIRLTEVGQRCRGARAQLDGLWDEARRRDVEAGLTGTELPYAASVWAWVEPQLDDYAAAWVAQHTEACEATSIRREQSPELMDARMTCLHRAKTELAAVVDVLANADSSVVEHAHDVVGRLPRIERCGDLDALDARVEPPRDEDAEVVDQIRRELAAARSERAAARSERAQERLDQAERLLDDVDYGPIRTELAFEKGWLLEDLGRYEESESSLREALASATRWKQWDETTRIASALMFVVGSRRQLVDEALRYRDLVDHASSDPGSESSTRNILAAVLVASGDFAEAEVQARRALVTGEQAWGPDHPRVAKAHTNLGSVLESQGRTTEAIEEMRRGLVVAENALGPDHPGVAIARFSLAAALHSAGDYTGAIEEHRKALDVQLRSLGPEHAKVAQSRSSLAIALRAAGEHAEAEAEQRKAIAGLEASVGPRHPRVAAARQALASVLYVRGDLEGAEREDRRALEIFTHALGAEHPYVARAHIGLASTLRALGRYRDAEAELRTGLQLSIAALGPEHPQVVMGRNNLGNLLYAQGRYEDAEQEHRAVLALKREVHGPEHPSVAQSHNNLANALRAQGELEAAEAEHRRALALRLDALGPDHPDVAQSRHNLSNVLALRGNLEEAEQEQRKALALWEGAHGVEHPLVANARAELASVLLQLGRPTHALSFAEQAWSRHDRDDVEPADRGRTAFVLARARWAVASDSEGRREARALAERALGSYDEASSPPSEDAAEIRRWLARHPAR